MEKTPQISSKNNNRTRRRIGVFALLLGAVFALGTANVFAQTPPDDAKKPASPFAWTKKFTQLIAPDGNDVAETPEPPAVAPPRPDAERPRPPKPLPIPANVGAVLETPSLRALDAGISTFFAQTSGVEFAPLTALRLTPFRSALSALDFDAPAGVFVFCETVPPTPVLVLPVDDFPRFVKALGADAKKPDAAGRVRISKPLDAFAQPFGRGFAAVYLPENADAAARFLNAPAPTRPTPRLRPGLKTPFLTATLTPRGVAVLGDPRRPFWGELNAFLTANLGDNAGFPIAANLDAFRQKFQNDLAQVRIDVALDEYGTYISTQTEPNPRSPGARRLAAVPFASPVDFTADRFFYILPNAEAPISGQAELSPPLVADLPAPFNRLRRVEYSLNLPRVGELAAESWLFYLEVDDAKAFVRELTVPNAKKIGRYMGEKQASELGAQIFGNIAARRLERQTGRRRPPRNYVDPQAAAERGAALGALIGGAIGESAGEKEALKEFDFYGYKAYISDLETYTRQTAIMRADEQGKIPPKPIVLNGDRVLLGLAGELISGLETGALETGTRDAFFDSAFADERFADPTPLFARRSVNVILDERRLLVGLGNERFLRAALDNWNAVAAVERAIADAEKAAADAASRGEPLPPRPPVPVPRYAADVQDVDFPVNWRNLGAQIPADDEFNVLGAVRFSPVDAQIMGAWLRQNYFPTLPDFAPKTLPKGTPQTLWTSSVSGGREFVRGVVPNRTIADVVRTFCDGKTPFELILTPKKGRIAETSESSEADGELDFDFGDE